MDEILHKAHKMKLFNHINVLPLIGVCVLGGTPPSIIMPFIDRGSLLSYLSKECPSLAVSELADKIIYVLFNPQKDIVNVHSKECSYRNGKSN